MNAITKPTPPPSCIYCSMRPHEVYAALTGRRKPPPKTAPICRRCAPRILAWIVTPPQAPLPSTTATAPKEPT